MIRKKRLDDYYTAQNIIVMNLLEDLFCTNHGLFSVLLLFFWLKETLVINMSVSECTEILSKEFLFPKYQDMNTDLHKVLHN
jgi:hypothetical protein